MDRAPLLFSSTLNADGLVKILRDSCVVAYAFDGFRFSLHIQSSVFKQLTSEILWGRLKRMLRHTGNYLNEVAPGMHTVERVRRINDVDRILYLLIASEWTIPTAAVTPTQQGDRWHFSVLSPEFFDDMYGTGYRYYNHDLCDVLSEFVCAPPPRRSEIYVCLFETLHPNFKFCLFSLLQAVVAAHQRRLAFIPTCKPPQN